jgi:hypothetical protein
MPHEVVSSAPVLMASAAVPAHGQPLRRIIVGVGLAVAGYMGLRDIGLAIVALSSQQAVAQDWCGSGFGWLSLYALQAAAVALGAAVAAAARPLGYTHGVLVGLLAAGVFFFWEIGHQTAWQHLPALLQIPLGAAIGLLAGWLGERLWPPPPALQLPQPRSSLLSSLQFVRQSLTPAVHTPPVPTRWLRVLLGAAIAAVVFLSADYIRLYIQRYSLGLLQVQSIGHAAFLSWLIATFGLGLGAVVAAAATSAGWRHGLFVGLLSAPIILAFASHYDTLPLPIEFTLTRLGLAGVPVNDPLAAAVVLGSILSLCAVAGWFGAALFPPLAPPAARQWLRSAVT